MVRCSAVLMCPLKVNPFAECVSVQLLKCTYAWTGRLVKIDVQHVKKVLDECKLTMYDTAKTGSCQQRSRPIFYLWRSLPRTKRWHTHRVDDALMQQQVSECQQNSHTQPYMMLTCSKKVIAKHSITQHAIMLSQTHSICCEYVYPQ